MSHESPIVSGEDLIVLLSRYANSLDLVDENNPYGKSITVFTVGTEVEPHAELEAIIDFLTPLAGDLISFYGIESVDEDLRTAGALISEALENPAAARYAMGRVGAAVIASFWNAGANRLEPDLEAAIGIVALRASWECGKYMDHFCNPIPTIDMIVPPLVTTSHAESLVRVVEQVEKFARGDTDAGLTTQGLNGLIDPSPN
jgi:hypothetical protein